MYRSEGLYNVYKENKYRYNICGGATFLLHSLLQAYGSPLYFSIYKLFSLPTFHIFFDLTLFIYLVMY